MTRLLVLSNDSTRAPAPGMRDGYQALVRSGELEDVRFASWRESTTESVLSAVGSDRWDALVVWSPRTFPRTQRDFQALDERLLGRPIHMWEGDHWASRRLSASAKQYWLPRTDTVFNSAGYPATQSFIRAGAKRVVPTISGYDHIRFEREEKSFGSNRADSLKSLVMIGSNPTNLLGKYLRPGASERRRLARNLRQDYSDDFSLFGRGWPRSWAVPTVGFESQVSAVRSHLVSTMWDHYPKLPLAASNRLAISLLAGRPHVMTLHPEAGWLQGVLPGLYLEPSVEDVRARIRELLGTPRSVALQLGEQAWRVARSCLSQRELVRYIMSHIDPQIAPPAGAVWDTLSRLEMR